MHNLHLLRVLYLSCTKQHRPLLSINRSLTSTIPSTAFLFPRLRLAPRAATAALRVALVLALADFGNREHPTPIVRCDDHAEGPLMRQPAVVSCWNALVRPKLAAKVSIASTAEEATVGRVEPPVLCGRRNICSIAATEQEWLAARGLAALHCRVSQNQNPEGVSVIVS